VQAGENVSLEERQEGFLVGKILKKSLKSPFDRWVGSLKQLKGKKPDELVKEMRDR
jgi:hypothetical protein